MLDFITRQTDWYTDATAKLNSCHLAVIRFVLPIGLDIKPGCVIRDFEPQLGYVYYDNSIIRGSFLSSQIKIINTSV